jgi:hypothetical protein
MLNYKKIMTIDRSYNKEMAIKESSFSYTSCYGNRFTYAYMDKVTLREYYQDQYGYTVTRVFQIYSDLLFITCK